MRLQIADLTDRAFEEYGLLTGRQYARASGYRTEDADWVIHLRMVPEGALPTPITVTPPYPAARRRDSVNG